MSTANINIDYCGIVNLLRQLVKSGQFLESEIKKIAERIAVQNGVEIVLFL